MNVFRLCKCIATLGPIGYVSAPGTVATLLTIPLIFWLDNIKIPLYLYTAILIAFFFISIGIIHCALKPFKHHHDPSEIVLDEILGCLITFWGIPFYLPAIIVGFILFRLLDIVKLGPIKNSEKIVGAWGIMIDDILAALISNIILRLIF